MSQPTDPSRDLLFGLLALQNGLIDQGGLFTAFAAWARDKGRSLADHLVDLGCLDAPRRAAVEAIVLVHLQVLGGDALKSLGALAIGRSTRESLARACGPLVEATLERVGSAHRSTQDDEDPDRTGSYSVGSATSDGQRFRILRHHAKGGLGAVFVALDSELDREVALKQILDDRANDPASRCRFLIEAQITGGLEHPGIVPVYGLGAHGDGRPYYAMRFIRGDSLKEVIDRFHGGPGRASAGRPTGESRGTDASRLALRQLLRRFLDVCNAIDYAHSRGVIHRDIKPANIIVGKHGETLVVDWGLAKATGRAVPGTDSGERLLVPSASGSSETLHGSALGTPAYMSPEQADGRLDRLGPRSDVYSLGATLYCLLTGKAPFAGEVGDVIHAVQRGEFRPPRQRDPSIDPALEAVCLKAMATQPEDRYATPRALADDLDRFMADEPVSAWREPLASRARRWARRNRTAVTAAAVALVAGVFGLSAVLAVQTKANTALAAANAELTRSQAAVQARYNLAVLAIKTFHTGVSEDFLLQQDQFKDVRDRLLKSASDFYGKLGALLGKESGLASRRALWQANYEGAVLTRQVGNPENALAAHQQVLAAREALAAQAQADRETDVDVGRSLKAIALSLENAGRTKESEAAYRKAEALLVESAPTIAAGAAARLVLAECRSRLGWLLHDIGRDDEALSLYRLARADQEALAAAPGATADSLRDLSFTICRIADLLADTGKPSAAEAESRKALGIRAKLVNDDRAVAEYRFRLAESHNQLAILLWRTGKLSEAEAECRKALAIQQKLADDSPAVANFRSSLATFHLNNGLVLSDTGKSREAEAEYRQALAIQRKLVDDNPTIGRFRGDLARTHLNFGLLLSNTGRSSQAAAEYREALVLQQKIADANPALTQARVELAGSHAGLAWVFHEAGNAVEAEAEYRRALAIQQKLADDNPDVTDFRCRLAESHDNLGMVFSGTGKTSEAESEYRGALALFQKLADDNPAVTRFRTSLAHTHYNLGVMLARTGKPSPAEAEYRKAILLLEKLADDNPAVPKFQHFLAASHSNIGGLENKTGHPEQALASYGRALAIQERLAREHAAVTDYQSELASTNHTMGTIQNKTRHPEEALVSYSRALAIRERLAREHPESADFASALGGTLNNIAMIHLARKRYGEARTKLEAAVSWQKKALAANPRHSQYRQFLVNHLANLINAAGGQKDAKGAAEARRALEELKASDQRFADLDARLAAVLKGDAPKDNTERLALAQRAYDTGRHYTAARLWGEALATDPKLTDDRQAQCRYNGACAAALAGCGKTQDNPAPDEATRAKLRAQARAWLDAEFAAWTRLLPSAKPQERAAIAATLEHWQADTDLAGVREPEAIDALPEPERAGWRELWKNVAEVLARARTGETDLGKVFVPAAEFARLDTRPHQYPLSLSAR
ncbi:MAG: protein kinase domain-containing protein [Isosphaeraceae bacterium]